MTITPETIAELRRLEKAATPGPWESDTVKTEGEFGTGPDTHTGFDEFVVYNGKGEPIFSTENAEGGVVEVDYDEYGMNAWNEDSRRLVAFIIAARNALPALLDEVERLQKLVYAPGQWRCPKCEFTLMQSNLNALDGTVTARDEAGDKCPNCNSPLWRVSWKDEAIEARSHVIRIFDEKQALLGEQKTLEAMLCYLGIEDSDEDPVDHLRRVFDTVEDQKRQLADLRRQLAEKDAEIERWEEEATWKGSGS